VPFVGDGPATAVLATLRRVAADNRGAAGMPCAGEPLSETRTRLMPEIRAAASIRSVLTLAHLQKPGIHPRRKRDLPQGPSWHSSPSFCEPLQS
jgi:hypothetical protein